MSSSFVKPIPMTDLLDDDQITFYIKLNAIVARANPDFPARSPRNGLTPLTLGQCSSRSSTVSIRR
ncbi:MAG TPA: hypothetical protein VGQ99_19775 [Tepidisphaeraceae bacterium]|nr:hypothetical protein [Tepidisphaeraceae bacterium]